MINFEKEMDEMCALVDEFAKCHISTDTPMFDFQQSMISNVRRYRKEKASQTTQCEHSGIEWDQNGNVVGVNP